MRTGEREAIYRYTNAARLTKLELLFYSSVVGFVPDSFVNVVEECFECVCY
jgi:hypothetical protein